jgi:hypothetical protein
MIIKALTLWQPWASLMIGGFKTIETRSWDTSHRGWLAIHAAKKEPKHIANALFGGMFAWPHLELFLECLREMSTTFNELPRGCILGVVYVTGTLPTNKLLRDGVGEYNKAFGDWSDGRFAWNTSHGMRFMKTYPVRGRQGLWSWAVPAELMSVREDKMVWSALTEPIEHRTCQRQ